jgi:hypothetical protein
VRLGLIQIHFVVAALMHKAGTEEPAWKAVLGLLVPTPAGPMTISTAIGVLGGRSPWSPRNLLLDHKHGGLYGDTALAPNRFKDFWPE